MIMVIRYAELFAGVGGFRLGIEQAESAYNDTRGVRCGTDLKERTPQHGGRAFHCVYSNEFDKHASATYRHIWRGTDQDNPCPELKEGDIREEKTDRIPDIDFLTAGFPCQSFSVAGKLGGFQDTRGTLFFEVARFLHDKRPRHFLLENVKNLVGHDKGKTFQTILGVLADIGYRFEWEVLNSTCWVPQNRERVFIIGHSRNECGCQVFPLREDDEVYTRSSGQDSVANCLDSNYWKGWLNKGQRTMVMSPAPYDSYREVEVPTALDSGAGRFRSSTCSIVGKIEGGGFSDNRICGGVAPTLMGYAKGADGHQSGISHRNPIVIHEHKSGTQTPHDEAVALRSGASHNYQKVSVIQRPHGFNQGRSKEYPNLRADGCSHQNEFIGSGLRFRRLTPVECERLQGWPDLHTAIGLYRATDLPKSRRNGSEYEMDLVSDTQRYRMTGNGVTADCVREIVKKMLLVGCFDAKRLQDSQGYHQETKLLIIAQKHKGEKQRCPNYHTPDKPTISPNQLHSKRPLGCERLADTMPEYKETPLSPSPSGGHCVREGR